MFNPNHPYNNLPPLPMEGIDFESKRILKALAAAKASIGRLDVFTQFLPDKEIFLTHFAIKESVESSQIERIETTVEIMYEASRMKEIQMSMEQKEVMYYKDALLLGTKLAKEKGFLATNEYVRLGGILSPKGKLRTGGLVNIKKNETEVIYTPPAGIENINRLLGNYENYYNGQIEHDIDPLIKTAMLHYQFEAIHPFYDGNGRTGRILMVLHLVLTGHLEFPIIFLSGFINKNKNTYYKLLAEVTSKKNWEEFIIFLLKAIEVQANETIRQIERIRKLRDEFIKTIENDSVIKSIYAEPLASILISKPKLLREDLKEFGSINTLTTYIRRLIELGILKESGLIGNSKVYTNIKFIELTK